MQNPFETILNELNEVKGLVSQLLTKPEDFSKKNYTVKDAAALFNVDTQTIRSHIEKGHIKATFIGRRILISHNELYDSLNQVKSIKYKRQA